MRTHSDQANGPFHRAVFSWRTILTTLALTLLFTRNSLASGTVVNCDEASLRAALASGGVVEFSQDCVITLSNTIVITNDTTLDATGHRVTIDGSNSVRVFYVSKGVTLNLINLKIANGQHSGTNGTLGVAGEPAYGGGIYNDQSTLNLTGCVFENNVAAGGLGGDDPSNIFGARPGGDASGGAIYTYLGQLNATDSVFSANKAVGGTGGNGQYGAPAGTPRAARSAPRIPPSI